MDYINHITKEIKSYHELKDANKNVSLPKHGTAIILKDWYYINATTPPTFNKLTEQCIDIEPVFDSTQYNQTWEVSTLPAEQQAVNLDNAKEQKRQEMKQSRLSATESTSIVTINSIDYEFDCDASARSAIHQSIDNATLAGLTDSDTTQWKLADNSFQSFTFGELKLAALQIAQVIQAQYTKEAVKNAEIEGADLTTIEAISWES